MRKKIRVLEQQASKADQLVEYLSKRNEYLKEQHKDAHIKKHSEYYSAYLNWREEANNWFRLRDEIDKTNEDAEQQAAAFVVRCQQIIDETTDFECLLDKELSNLEISYTEILQFIKQEPVWQDEVENLLSRPLYYEYLYGFHEAREEGNLGLVSDLLQRRMHKDFMNMAYQERRQMRRQLPNACKNMLDERGLLAQEINKINMWCNRLGRRQERLTLPETKLLENEQLTLRNKIHHQVMRRQPILIQTKALTWRLRGCNVKLHRKRTSYQQLDIALNKTRKKLEKTEFVLESEAHNNRQKRAVAEALKNNVMNLQGMVTRDYQQRLVNSQVLGKIATALKKAFGVPSDFYNMHWPARGAIQDGLDEHPNSMVTHLRHILDIARASSAKAVLPSSNVKFTGSQNLLRYVPVSLQKFSS